MSNVNIQPLGDNLLLEPIVNDEQKTESGIYLPETAEGEKPQEGLVVATGDDEKIKVKKGDKVIFKKFSETEIKVENKDYYIIKNEDILAVIK